MLNYGSTEALFIIQKSLLLQVFDFLVGTDNTNGVCLLVVISQSWLPENYSADYWLEEPNGKDTI